MALEITGTIELTNGLSLNTLYGRTQYSVNDDSSSVFITNQFWIDETSYTNKKSSVSPYFNVDGMYDYNRITDGSDVLDFTNKKIKEQLELLGFSVVITEL